MKMKMDLWMKMIRILSTFSFLLRSMGGCACMCHFTADVDEGMLYVLFYSRYSARSSKPGWGIFQERNNFRTMPIQIAFFQLEDFP